MPPPCPSAAWPAGCPLRQALERCLVLHRSHSGLGAEMKAAENRVRRQRRGKLVWVEGKDGLCEAGL